MTKKTVLALAVALAITRAGISQGTDSTKFKKNEIGFNIAPIVVAIIGGETSRPTFSISYNRLLKEKCALRFALKYQESIFSWNNGESYYIVSQTDSTQLRRYTERNDGAKIQGNIGYECRFGKRKIKYFFGTDLALGFSKNNYEIYDESFVLVKNYYQGLYYSPQSGGVDTLYLFIPDENSFSNDIYSETTQTVSIGTSPFFGFYYPFNKKFSLSFQTGFDVSFSSGIMKSKDYMKNEVKDVRISTFDFNINGLINDLSLVYRF